MNKQQLDSLVLGTLRSFEKDCSAHQRVPLLAYFGNMFLMRNGISLKKAIAAATGRNTTVRSYMTALPGVEVSQSGMADQIRLLPMHNTQHANAYNLETPVESTATADRISLAPLEEECRLALLRDQSAKLPAKLVKRIVDEVGNAPKYIEPLKKWAEEGHMFRFEAESIVARGEDKSSFAFDDLKRDVLKHVDGLFTGNRRLAAATIMLEPFFVDGEIPDLDIVAAQIPQPPPTVQSPPTPVKVPQENIPSKKFLLGEILKFAAWDGPAGETGLSNAFLELERHYPEAIEDGNKQREKGRKLRELKAQARKAGSTGGPLFKILAEMNSVGIGKRFGENLIRKAYENGARARQKAVEAQRLRKRMPKQGKQRQRTPGGNPIADTEANRTGDEQLEKILETIRNGQANALPSLKPSPSWTVLIDETGSDFSSHATGKTCGRMVALFVPRETMLPDLPKNWHAVDVGLEGRNGILDVVERIKTSQCGILGIPVTILPDTTVADQWFSCIEDILAMSLRILPLEGATNVSIYAEQRGLVSGQNGAVMLSKTVADVLHRLARVFPDRAKKLTVESHIISKDEHPWNGYVDAIAYTWGSSSLSPLLPQTGWVGPCLLNRNAATLLGRSLDALRTEGTPSGGDWAKLISLPESDDDTSLCAAFLRALGHEAQTDNDMWCTFLDEARRHLDSKAIRMDVLARQLRWLKRWEPIDADLPPRTRLMWLAAELASANHIGRTDVHETDAFRKEFDDLVTRLRREDCPLCAHALLHLAVAYTNAFEFEKARSLLLPMCEWPVEGLGLRMEGRLLSSIGQHEAFLGNHAKALQLFDKAIALFRDLSEASGGEIAQTGAYAATAAMDAHVPDADERLAAYLWSGQFSDEKLASEARRLATSAEPIEKYAHHILLRRLVELPTDHPARSAYLAEMPRWAEPVAGHPWELIEFYRAWLLQPGPERDKRLKTAREIAFADGGATLQVIAAVIDGAAFCEGAITDRTKYDDLVACCAEAIPALGTARISALRNQADPATRLPPSDFIKAVLPFNFR